MDWTRLAYGFAANLLGLFVAGLLGLLETGGFFSLVITAIVLGVVNALIRPVITVLSLPAIVLTFGLFIFVVNALMLWLTSIVVPSFEVLGFWQTVGAAVVMGVVNLVLHAAVGDINREHLEKARKSVRGHQEQ